MWSSMCVCVFVIEREITVCLVICEALHRCGPFIRSYTDRDPGLSATVNTDSEWTENRNALITLGQNTHLTD